MLEPVEFDDEDRALAARLMSERSAEDIAAALVHAHRAAMPQAEDLIENTPEARQADRQERHRAGFEDVVWFRMDIGRRQNADPRWILPLLCRRGHITRNEIGAIRISANETHFRSKGRGMARRGEREQATTRSRGPRARMARRRRHGRRSLIARAASPNRRQARGFLSASRRGRAMRFIQRMTSIWEVLGKRFPRSVLSFPSSRCRASKAKEVHTKTQRHEEGMATPRGPSLQERGGTMRLSWFVSFLLALSASGAHAQAGPNPTAWFSGPSGRSTVPLQRSIDQKLYLTVMVKGQPLNLFIDTGATTIVHVDVARQLGLPLTDTEDETVGLNGVSGTRQLTFVDMALGKTIITNYQVSAIDLSLMRELHAKHRMPVFDGLIGADLLAVLRARVDFDKLVREVRRPDQATLDRIGFTPPAERSPTD
jgi:predicted aspartyl protease